MFLENLPVGRQGSQPAQGEFRLDFFGLVYPERSRRIFSSMETDNGGSRTQIKNRKGRELKNEQKHKTKTYVTLSLPKGCTEQCHPELLC
ncbi:hypothetical protein OOZ15_14055 [Galbibacter sp. EGI 63066]|uniref:hypothetical protein n=1 Tax=Galbibacter sp. EGI 63066 TaxID=2993559 RepID=UPI002249010E|nr:hypothetical protein [Galbibacter sp. EGI 63066]MCX2681072.1 hypothetical protein [Galbibacter sp. EGI 63066]